MRIFVVLALALLSSSAGALPVTTHKGMVVAAHPLAAKAGAQVLAEGGNAADALVATAFALGVVEPYSSGLGGGGFALLYEAKSGAVKVLDFREIAPAATHPGMFLRNGKYDPELSRHGGLAVAVPGAVAGYAAVAKQFGTKPLSALVEPAARLAEQDTPFSAAHRRAIDFNPTLNRTFPALTEPFGFGTDVIGRKRRQPVLAKFLRSIGSAGAAAFYSGAGAEAIIRAVHDAGGILTSEDLSHYQVRPLTPLEGTFRGHRIVTVPPPSAGGFTILATLEALDGMPAAQMAYGTAERDRLLIEIFNRVYAARAEFAGDPRKEPRVTKDVTELLKPEVLASWRRSIGANATPSTVIDKQIKEIEIKEGPETSHLCVVDAAGNVALMTTTINGAFGSGVYVPELGILLNNEMDDFAPPEGGNLFGLVGGRFNAPAPGKTPVSTMSPTLVFDGTRPWIGVGAAGGSTIATTIAQIILHVVDDGMDVQQAMAAPRIHSQFLPEVAHVDLYGIEEETRKVLTTRGYKIEFWPPRNNAQALVIGANSLRQGSGDPRGEGAAVAEDLIDVPAK